MDVFMNEVNAYFTTTINIVSSYRFQKNQLIIVGINGIRTYDGKWINISLPTKSSLYFSEIQ